MSNGFEDAGLASICVHRRLLAFDRERRQSAGVRLGTPLSMLLAVFLAVKEVWDASIP